MTNTQPILASEILELINLDSSELVTINQLVDIVGSIAGVTLERNFLLMSAESVSDHAFHHITPVMAGD